MTNDNYRSAPAVRAMIAEDFEPFRQFYRSALSKFPNLQIVGEASDGLEAVCLADELQPDLILLDIGLPGLNGIEAALQIRARCPAGKIIFVTQESADYFVQEAFRVGTMAYVLKTGAGKDLVSAVDAVLNGRQFVSAGLADLHVQAASQN